MLRAIIFALLLSPVIAGAAVTGDFQHPDVVKVKSYSDTHPIKDRAGMLRSLRNGEDVYLRVSSYIDLVLDPAGRKMVTQFPRQIAVIEGGSLELIRPFIFKGLPLLSRPATVQFHEIKRAISKLRIDDNKNYLPHAELYLVDALTVIKSVMVPIDLKASDTFKLGVISLASVTGTNSALDYMGIRTEQVTFEDYGVSYTPEFMLRAALPMSEIFFFMGGKVNNDFAHDHCGKDMSEIERVYLNADKRIRTMPGGAPSFPNFFPYIAEYFLANCNQIQLNRQEFAVKRSGVNDLQSAINASGDKLVTLKIEDYLSLIDLIQYNDVRLLLKNIAIDVGNGQGAFSLSKFSQLETEGLTPKIDAKLVYEYMDLPFWAVNLNRVSFTELHPHSFYMSSSRMFHPRDPVVEALGIPVIGVNEFNHFGFANPDSGEYAFDYADLSNTMDRRYVDGVAMLNAMGIKAYKGSEVSVCSAENENSRLPNLLNPPVESIISWDGGTIKAGIPWESRDYNTRGGLRGANYTNKIRQFREAGMTVKVMECKIKESE